MWHALMCLTLVWLHAQIGRWCCCASAVVTEMPFHVISRQEDTLVGLHWYVQKHKARFHINIFSEGSLHFRVQCCFDPPVFTPTRTTGVVSTCRCDHGAVV